MDSVAITFDWKNTAYGCAFIGMTTSLTPEQIAEYVQEILRVCEEFSKKYSDFDIFEIQRLFEKKVHIYYLYQ